ncbi:MAG: hypothetical protein PT944_06190 [Actinomycetaceae bacterium]|nr:hypothetical protein [Arcanobacterium sp.]MDD7687485.1 hypothetical protein [Actinomycetaceae bacterium]MDY5272960.1 hypothetical protein [Arcanobacterium sp.]
MRVVKKWNAKTIFGVLLASTGVMLTAVTAWHAATFNPEKIVTLTADSTPEAIFIYTAPGVLNIVTDQPRVTLTASQADDVIEWGYGSSKDVAGYVGASAARTVRGFANEGRELLEPAVEDHRADSKTNDADKKTISAGGFHLSQSDQWEKAGSGKGTVSFDLDVEPGVDRSLIATSSTGVAPQLTLSWVRTERMASPAPFIVMGVLLALIGAVLLLTAWRDQMKRETLARQEAQTQAYREERAMALTTELPAFHGDLAHPSTDRAVQHAHTDGAFGAGVLPGTSRTLSIRERDLSEKDRLIIAEPMGDEAGDETGESHAANGVTADGVSGEHGSHATGARAHRDGERRDADETDNITLWTYTEPFENDEGEDELIDDTQAWERGGNA